MTNRPATLECHKQVVGEVIHAMRRDPSAPFDLESMAALVFMSEGHFLRTFEEVTGVSPARFLAALRIERAKRMLLETSLPVTSICLEAGYNSQGTFTRLFAEFVGLPPMSFRKLREDLTPQSLHVLIADYLRRQARRRSLPTSETLSGTVRAPVDFSGVIFVGSYASVVPRGRPMAGALLLHPGKCGFEITGTSRPRCVFAAAFPTHSDSIRYLLPSQDELLVASAVVPAELPDPPARWRCDLTLRPPEHFDPPILTALPLLLKVVDVVNRGHS